MTDPPNGEVEPTGRCPICGTQIEGNSTSCEHCGIRYHTDCWDYSGKCAVYGCGVLPAPDPSLSLRQRSATSGGLWALGSRLLLLSALIPASLMAGLALILTFQNRTTMAGGALLALPFLPALARHLKRCVATRRLATETFYRSLGLLLLVVLMPGFDRLDFPLLNWTLLLLYAGIVAKALHLVPQAGSPTIVLIEIVAISALIFSQLEPDVLTGPGTRHPVQTAPFSPSFASRLDYPVLIRDAQRLNLLDPSGQRPRGNALSDDSRPLPKDYCLLLVPSTWTDFTFEQLRALKNHSVVRVRLLTIWERWSKAFDESLLGPSAATAAASPRGIVLPADIGTVYLRYTAPGSSFVGDELAVFLHDCRRPPHSTTDIYQVVLEMNADHYE
jgi:hypothetical protein